ncbi:hypothetical protein K435DRAFT_796940 [Dendrothele bispora CBS 962.96]|uniref:Uncharacterized protein n=1 Tax=Dendrothele bispora (strain CBS 962.96) TaxID=1314807 RepID=A0A4S8M560_DENBC|nr:hypothetical protein K435DRAFT_796940 [Dendrothele bispora CBS 962.96]
MPRPTPIFQFSIGVSAAITQTFMLRRYWRLTKKKVVLYPVSLLIFSAFGAAASLSIFIAVFPNNSQRSLANVLVIRFNYFSRFDHTDYIKSCRVQVHKRTGMCTALIEAMIIILYMINSQSDIFLVFVFCLGHVYSLTLLYNLNIRRSLRQHEIMIDVESIHLSGSPEMNLVPDTVHRTNTASD